MFSLIVSAAVIGDVTKRVIMPPKTPQVGKKPANPIGYLTGQNSFVSNFFYQQNLTQNLFRVKNKDNYFFQKMGKFGKLAGGARNAAKALGVIGLLAGPAVAQEQTNDGTIQLAPMVMETSIQIRDCQTEVKAFREQLQAEGVDRDELKIRVRAEMRACRSDNISSQETEIARLDSEFLEMKAWLQARGLDVNEKGNITDSEGRLLAEIEVETTELRGSTAELRGSTAELREGTAELREGTAELREGTAALRADTEAIRIERAQIQMRIITLDAEYRQMLADFGQFLSSMH